MHSSVCHWRRIWGSFEQFLQHFLHISSLKREQKLCLDWFWEESYFSVATASTEQSERDRTCLWLSCHAFGFYNERPGWRVDTSRPESVCHRHRRRKRRGNIRSRFDLYCVSLKDFHQSVIEPRLVFYIDQMNLPASPNFHCNGLLLLCKNEPHERLVWHKNGKTI